MKKSMIALFITFFILCTIVPAAFAEEDKTVAIVDFTNTTDYYLPEIGEMAAETLSILVSQVEHFKVVERSKLKDIVTEQRFSASGLVDNTATAIQMGKLLGANYIITGSIINLTEQKSTFNGYGISTTQIIFTLDISIKLININTGVIELANIYTAQQSFQDAVPSNKTSVVRNLLKTSQQRFISDIKKLQSASTPQVKMVFVEFKSTPAGADIEIDGIYLGSTPARIPYQEGIHTIRITLAGYEPWEKKVLFYDGLIVNVTLGEKEKK